MSPVSTPNLREVTASPSLTKRKPSALWPTSAQTTPITLQALNHDWTDPMTSSEVVVPNTMVRTSASFDAAPLQLEPQYPFMHEPTEPAYVEYCAASDTETTGDRVFVMLAGGSHCMSHEIMSDRECARLGHDRETDGHDQATDISPHHFTASCSGLEWVDLQLPLSADDFHCTYLIEVEDLMAATGLPDPTALSLHMYDNAIPQNCKMDHMARRAIDGMCSVAINQHNFHEGYAFLSVKREAAGATPRHFRAMVYQIEEHLTLDQEHHGVVSPGKCCWVCCPYAAPTNGSLYNFTFHLAKHTGDLDRHDVLPLKLMLPYGHAGHQDYKASTIGPPICAAAGSVCDATRCTDHVRSLATASRCAAYPQPSTRAAPPACPASSNTERV